MHMTVFVASSSATSHRGASVSLTTHSGITMCSRTWLVQETPSRKVVAIQPGLRSGPGPGTLALRSSGVLESWEASGSRVIAAALTRKTDAVNHGSPCRSRSPGTARASRPTAAPMVKPALSAEYM